MEREYQESRLFCRRPKKMDGSLETGEQRCHEDQSYMDELHLSCAASAALRMVESRSRLYLATFSSMRTNGGERGRSGLGGAWLKMEGREERTIGCGGGARVIDRGNQRAWWRPRAISDEICAVTRLIAAMTSFQLLSLSTLR